MSRTPLAPAALAALLLLAPHGASAAAPAPGAPAPAASGSPAAAHPKASAARAPAEAAPAADPDPAPQSAPTVVIQAPPPWTTHRPDGHGPGGVMADHLHARGEAMIGYRYMHMGMGGILDGTRSVDAKTLFADGYQMVPRDMSMDMHMINGMLGVTRRLTLTIMVPVTVLSMHMTSAKGMVKSMHVTGLGDVEATALFGIARWMGMRLHGGLGVVAPTGSTDVRDDTGAPLPYPMQLGSGTFGLEPSVTWLGERYRWSWGAQALGTVRLGRNAEGYRLGNRLDVNLWGARRLVSWASVSARLEVVDAGGIVGADGRLPAMAAKMMPTADPAATGGFVLDGYLGLNLRVPSGLFYRHRLAVEVGLPLFQSLTGPQLAERWSIAVAWQYTH